MTSSPLALEQDFRAILVPDSIRFATPADAVAGVQPSLILEPATEQQLAAALRVANEAGLAVIPRGGSTKLGWGNPPQRADIILSTARLNKIIEHPWADLTVSVEAGCTIERLQAALAKHGQRLALDPLWPERATVGGVLSTNDSGSLRLRFGALRDLIIGATIALPDGTLASSGGKVVKNVAGYDLQKLVTGAFGTLGVITRAVFRLHPLPRNTKTLSILGSTLDGIQRVVLGVQDSQLAHTSLQVRLAKDAEPIADILFDGKEGGIAAQESQLRSIAGSAQVVDAHSAVWSAAQELWNEQACTAIAKITTLPAAIAQTVQTVQHIADPRKTQWKVVMQATGVGWLRLDGTLENIHDALADSRLEIERAGGSLCVFQQPGQPQGASLERDATQRVETWGRAGDMLALMRAVKKQFDPRNTLNPGRFVGGI